MPIDSSESRGTAQSEFVLGLPNAADDIRVTLVYVFDKSDERAKEEKPSPRQIVGGKAADEQLRDAGVTIEQMSRVGDPATQILAAADEVDADLLVLGGRKRSPLGSLLFGSVTQAVVLDSERPVTITGGEK